MSPASFPFFLRRQQRSSKNRPSSPGRRPLTFDVLERRDLLSINPVINPLPEAPQIVLTPTVLTSLRAEATADTAQWQAFKSQLDGSLKTVFQGGYEGSDLTWIADYALGYQVLMTIDPTTAAEYADKAIGIMKSGLDNYQISSWNANQFLVRGNGTTTTFTLANSDIIPSSVQVYLAPVTTTAVVKGAANGQDTVGYYQDFLKVSNTPDGPANYTQGVDWQRNGNDADNVIDWSLGGNQPATGATYYVTSVIENRATPVHATLNGDQITLSTAPTANQAVMVQYVYGTHALDGSTLAYQQTNAGDGGFNSIFVDDNYSARYLAYMAMGVDWLDGYVGMSQSLKSETIIMLERWSSYLVTNGYKERSPASNYGVDEYMLRAFTALAIEGRSSDATSYMSEVLAYRTNNELPLLEDPTTSLAGGFWAEGWSYGARAAKDLLVADLALEAGGYIDASPERTWAGQVITQLVSDQATQATIYDGGDLYTHPLPFPIFDTIDVFTAATNDAAARSYGNYILQNYQQPYSNDFIDLLFRKPNAAAAYWSSLPLQNYATGTGLLTVRSDWGTNPDWASIQMGTPLIADHQSFTPGQVQIQRGADDLLVNASAVGLYNGGWLKSKYGNTIIVNDNGDGAQSYEWSMGPFYGPVYNAAGVVINAYEAANNYVYFYGDYHAAYSTEQAPGSGGSTSELTRQFVYLRPDLVIVYDRVTTIKATYPKEQQWMFSNAPTVNGNSFVETVGSSSLFGQTYSTVPLTTTAAPVTVGDATVQQLITQNASPTASVRYVTAFQVAPSSTSSMDASTHILSTDSSMEGVEIGGNVVLFGRNGDVSPSDVVTYQVYGSGTLTQLLTNLKAGTIYDVQVDGVHLSYLTASSQGTITFTTNGGAHTMSVVGTLTAFNDSYVVNPTGANSVSAALGVLANDSDPSGTSLTATLVSGPQHGSLTFNTNGSFTYTPGSSFTGSDTFTYTASDGQHTSNVATVTLATLSAVDESYVVAPSGTTTVTTANGVLANDVDPAGGSLTATLRNGPQHGSLNLNANGSFTYTPGAHFAGSDSFTYTDGDGQHTSNVATVTLSVTVVTTVTAADDVYVLSASGTNVATAQQGVLANDSTTSGTLTGVLRSGPSHGTLTLNADGSFTYTVGAGFAGIDAFTYVASSGGVTSSLTTVTLLSQPAAVVRKLYQQWLLREPDTAGLQLWTSVIVAGGSYTQVAQSIVDSDERLDRLINQLYVTYLHRAADGAGLALWRDDVWKPDGGPENVVAGIVASDEFYASSGGTNTAWVTALYESLLGRAPDAAGLAVWDNILNENVMTRDQIVLSFQHSPEDFADLVTSWYEGSLDRAPDAAALNAFVNLLEAGVSDLSIQLMLIGSAEYRNSPAPPAAGTVERWS